MKFITKEQNLQNSTYPGRGIVVGKTPDGKHLVQIYWIMGRSVNSRNRIFETDRGFMRTKAFDESKMTDPSLVIYYPMKHINKLHIVTNGDQTDTIYSFIQKGSTFKNALETREFEPDPPNYTPRISGIINADTGTYELAVLKTINNNGELGQKNFFSYDKFIKGIGHCLTTYVDDGNPLPSFAGEPYMVGLYNDINETAENFWDYLNDSNRVSLAVKFIDARTGESEIRIINKNK